MTQRISVVVFHRSMVNWQGVNLKVTLAVNLKVTLNVNSTSKLEGDSVSKLEEALLLGTRCHCMNTSSENMQSFQVCPLDVIWQGSKLEGVSGSKLEGDSGSKLAADSASKLECDWQ